VGSFTKPKSLLEKSSRKILFRALERATIGSLKIVDVTGGRAETFQFGSAGRKPSEPVAELHIHSPAVYSRVLLGGTIGSGESYMDGEWSSPDLTQVTRFFVANRETMSKMDSNLTRAFTAPLEKVSHLLRSNTKNGARSNIQAHYDLGNDFFELFLDETWMYSSAIFPTPETPLHEAQKKKLDRICQELRLGPSDRVVEIGTGWGGFAIHAAKNYGCHVTTTTISDRQYEFARERVKALGLEDRITLLKQDYRDLPGTYDALVSIEMIEAVGLKFLPTYFEKCASLLKPDGRALIQSITIREHHFESAAKSVDFIQRHVFPGSAIPSLGSITLALRRTDLTLDDAWSFGQHYARTLQEWAKKLNAKKQRVLELGYTPELFRMWQFYLSYCEGGFRENAISVHHLKLSKPRTAERISTYAN
jgi:cyclopropane-fatty-acyl-phospholipid synthase